MNNSPIARCITNTVIPGILQNQIAQVLGDSSAWEPRQPEPVRPKRTQPTVAFISGRISFVTNSTNTSTTQQLGASQDSSQTFNTTDRQCETLIVIVRCATRERTARSCGRLPDLRNDIDGGSRRKEGKCFVRDLHTYRHLSLHAPQT